MAFRDNNSQPAFTAEVAGYGATQFIDRHEPVPGHDGFIVPMGLDRMAVHAGLKQIRVDGRLLCPMSHKVVPIPTRLNFAGKDVAISVA